MKKNALQGNNFAAHKVAETAAMLSKWQKKIVLTMAAFYDTIVKMVSISITGSLIKNNVGKTG
jgi:hypothetical protein